MAGTAKVSDRRTPEYPLNVRQSICAHETLKHPFVRMCMNELSKRLFTGSDIIVTEGGTPKSMSDDFRTILRRDMRALAQEGFETIQVLGVVPIAFKKSLGASGLGSENLIPYVPRFGTYMITTWSEDGIQRYKFHWTNLFALANASRGSPFQIRHGGTLNLNMQPHDLERARFSNPHQLLSGRGPADDSVIVMSNFMYSPTINGQLTSNLWVIQEKLEFVRQLETRAMLAENIRTLPPLLYGHNHQADSSERTRQRDLARRAQYAGSEPDREAGEGSRSIEYQRTDAQLEEYFRHLDTISCATGVDYFAERQLSRDLHTPDNPMDVSARGSRKFNWRGHEMPWSNAHYIGQDRTPVQYPMPEARSDLGKIEEMTMEVVCAVLNVPRGLISPNAVVRAGAELNAESTAQTIDKYADVLSDLMTRAYAHAFGLQDICQSIQECIFKKGRALPQFGDAPISFKHLLTKEDLFAVEKSSEVRLALDVSPATSAERVQTLYDRGVIDKQTYGESMLRLNNLPRSAFSGYLTQFSGDLPPAIQDIISEVQDADVHTRGLDATSKKRARTSADPAATKTSGAVGTFLLDDMRTRFRTGPKYE